MEEKKKNLKNIYDVINFISRKHKERGEDTSSWFYTKEEFEQIKKNPKNKIL